MPTTAPLTTLPDADLGRRAIRGDRDAFAELFARHERGLFQVCHRLTGDREEAADLVQESFLRVFAQLEHLEGREVNLPAYLHRTARNLVYDRSSRRAAERATAAVEELAGADEALEVDPERSALLGDQQMAVRRANAALPERQRLALALRELQDMDYAEIGVVLDMRPEAVGQLLVRARLALRRNLRRASVDEDALPEACRARLGQVGALIDGELDADRAGVLAAHMAGCPACTAARQAMEDARIRYRAWLPVPLVAGLGARTARAAEGRGLLPRPGVGGMGAGGGAAVLAGAGVDELRAASPRAARRRRAAATAGVAALLVAAGAGVLLAEQAGGPDVGPARVMVTVRTTAEPPTPTPTVTRTAPVTTTTAAAPEPSTASASVATPVPVRVTDPAVPATPRVTTRPRTRTTAPVTATNVASVAPPQVSVATATPPPAVTTQAPPPPTTTQAPPPEPPPPTTTQAPPTTDVPPTRDPQQPDPQDPGVIPPRTIRTIVQPPGTPPVG